MKVIYKCIPDLLMGQRQKLSGLGCFKRVDFPTVEYQLTLTGRMVIMSFKVYCLGLILALVVWESHGLGEHTSQYETGNGRCKRGFEKAPSIQTW